MGKLKKVILWSLGLVAMAVVAFAAFLFYQFTFVLSGPRTDTPFAEAHAKAVHSFVNGQGFGIARFREKEYFFEVSVNFEGEEWAVDNLVLVGASNEYGERYFEELSQRKSQRLRKGKLKDANPRVLDKAEEEAIRNLREKNEDWVELEVREILLDSERAKKAGVCSDSRAGELFEVP